MPSVVTILHPNRSQPIDPPLRQIIEVDVVRLAGHQVDQHEPFRSAVLGADLRPQVLVRDVAVVGHPDRHVVALRVGAVLRCEFDEHPPRVGRKVSAGLTFVRRQVHRSDDVVSRRLAGGVSAQSRGLAPFRGVAERLEETSLIGGETFGVLRRLGRIGESHVHGFDLDAGVEIADDERAVAFERESSVGEPGESTFAGGGSRDLRGGAVSVDDQKVAVAGRRHAGVVTIPDTRGHDRDPFVEGERAGLAGLGVDVERLPLVGLADPSIEQQTSVGGPANPFGKCAEPRGVRHRLFKCQSRGRRVRRRRDLLLRRHRGGERHGQADGEQAGKKGGGRHGGSVRRPVSAREAGDQIPQAWSVVARREAAAEGVREHVVGKQAGDEDPIGRDERRRIAAAETDDESGEGEQDRAGERGVVGRVGQVGGGRTDRGERRRLQTFHRQSGEIVDRVAE